jgi:hypothetical protein
LLASSDPYAQLAAYPLVTEIDGLVEDASRAAWSKWLARHLPHRRPAAKRSRAGEVAADAFHRLNALFPLELVRPELAKAARAQADKALAADELPEPDVLAFAATTNDGDALFDRIVDRARATQDTHMRIDALHMLGAFPQRFVDRTAALAVDKPELPIDPIWDALASYFENPATRTTAWHALQTRLGTFMKRAGHRGVDIIDAAGSLCWQPSRDEVAAAFKPYLDKVPDGRAHLARALASIDACIARRSRIGDLAGAIDRSR